MATGTTLTPDLVLQKTLLDELEQARATISVLQASENTRKAEQAAREQAGRDVVAGTMRKGPLGRLVNAYVEKRCAEEAAATNAAGVTIGQATASNDSKSDVEGIKSKFMDRVVEVTVNTPENLPLAEFMLYAAQTVDDQATIVSRAAVTASHQQRLQAMNTPPTGSLKRQRNDADDVDPQTGISSAHANKKAREGESAFGLPSSARASAGEPLSAVEILARRAGGNPGCAGYLPADVSGRAWSGTGIGWASN